MTTTYHNTLEFWSCVRLTSGMIGAGIILMMISSCATTQPSGKIIVQPDTVYMKANGWTISFSPNIVDDNGKATKNPTDNSNDKGWHVNMPNVDGLHMILVPYHANKPHKTLTITYRVTAISGTPTFLSVDPCTPNEAASFRPMLERTGDTLSASQEFYRWWSSPTALVADGQVHTVSFPLTYDKWTVKKPKNFKGAVFGKTDPNQFHVATGDLMAVGISFGGCYAAHGAKAVNGQARFELLDYQIQ
jgi:hypothetical protein